MLELWEPYIYIYISIDSVRHGQFLRLQSKVVCKFQILTLYNDNLVCRTYSCVIIWKQSLQNKNGSQSLYQIPSDMLTIILKHSRVHYFVLIHSQKKTRSY